MYSLNLPSYDAKIRKNGSIVEIYDTLRRKYVALTPEEWVRQHFVNWLVSDKNYPVSLMANETAIKLNSLSRRCDTVVYNQLLEPLMIIEYKESNIPVSQGVFDQVVRYNTVLKVKYIVVSNGINHYCCKMDYEKQSYDFLTDIPNYIDL
ncbi:MAG TPA: type I restriction enzyme HsdR N-terminal domain-containing protein [Chitinophagales bacterium]|nr:type I restriction enzyme HsdR N-terminal domain-containing protein [Chitinophagales bacterium]